MFSKELTAASSKPLILSLLAHGDNYGYNIIKQLKQLSNEKIIWSDAMLYPVLRRMENDKLITSYWQIEDGRKRKYYRITPAGKKEGARKTEEWQSTYDVLVKLRQPKLSTQ